MATDWTAQSEGEWNYPSNKYVVTGYTVRRYEGTGTAFETVARPAVPGKLSVWGTPVGGSWKTQEEADVVASRLQAGETVEGLVWASYSND